MKKRLTLLIMAVCCISGYAQEDAYLKQLTKELVSIRTQKVSEAALRTAVVNWSASERPKITIMDDVGFDRAAECRGSDANSFKVNQLVTRVYKRQNMTMVSKGEYFNSTERDIHYSAIEKTIKKGCTATYTLTGHVGRQEFVLMSFNPKSRFKATVNGREARETDVPGVMTVDIGKVRREDKIVITISNLSSGNESFVILNHNPQK